MPIIDVSLSPGRTTDQLRALVEELTEATHSSLGVSRDRVRILLREVPDTHWATAGVTTEQAKQEGTH
ncbi:4-oxalocrotonate tautomerase [Tamaricihabitans halophyticus]|uniref:4-oxalocrotonate tautomerase n=1 Tax=Tamaricihabitans halophyticus TaxID=1262583 RepID=A0A4R2PVP2_9PSEU|nr:tautomerase family protein [Tamaricihabitans halophyticus]TCP39178.1 4-oxalocrotonate tautomerase [Tamaricihabitans halophyticus]